MAVAAPHHLLSLWQQDAHDEGHFQQGKQSVFQVWSTDEPQKNRQGILDSIHREQLRENREDYL